MKLPRSSSVLLAALCVILAAPSAHAANHLMQIEQVIGGVNGDVTAQAIQLRMRAAFQNQLQGSRIRAWDAAGANPVLLLDMTTAVINHGIGVRVLLTTPSFHDYLSGALTSDFTLATPIPASYLAAGSLTFEADAGTLYWRVSWGGAGYTGLGTVVSTNDAQLDGTFNPPILGALPHMTTQSIVTTLAASAKGNSTLADYTTSAAGPTFTNNAAASQTVTGIPGCAVYPGLDLFTTPGNGSTYQDFGGNPIPASFFGPGSDPFTGVVTLQGLPLAPASPLGPSDTIVRRRTAASLPNPGDVAPIPIEIVALHLASVNPITVTYNGGATPEQWQVDACLSSAGPQQQGVMNLQRGDCDCSEGGTFSSVLPVLPKLVFTRTLPTPAVQVLDFGAAAMPPILFQVSGGRWLPQDPGFNLVVAPAGLSVDHDCDIGTPAVPNLPPTTNFFAGVRADHCLSGNCGGAPVFAKRLTLEQSALAAHGIVPAQLCAGDQDGDGLCDDADNCRSVSNQAQLDTDGDGIGDVCDNCASVVNVCQEDANGNQIGDVCDVAAVGDPQGSGGVRLGPASPNPARDELGYTVSLERDGHVRVAVFSLSGRLVQTLVDRELTAGVHRFSWATGVAGGGGPVSGMYFLRLVADGVRQTRTFALIR